MTLTDLQRIFLERLRLRIGPETAAYVLRRLQAQAASPLPPGPIPVLAGDARTGLPVRKFISPSDLPAVSPAGA